MHVFINIFWNHYFVLKCVLQYLEIKCRAKRATESLEKAVNAPLFWMIKVLLWRWLDFWLMGFFSKYCSNDGEQFFGYVFLNKWVSITCKMGILMQTSFVMAVKIKWVWPILKHLSQKSAHGNCSIYISHESKPAEKNWTWKFCKIFQCYILVSLNKEENISLLFYSYSVLVKLETSYLNTQQMFTSNGYSLTFDPFSLVLI